MRPLRSSALLLATLLCTASASAAPTRRVFGYIYAGNTPARWDLLTDVAFFSETLTTAGTFPTSSWSGAGKTLVTNAHAHGVRVELTVNLFNSSGGSEISTFLASVSARSTAITNMVAAVQANGADGISLDFEFVGSSAKAEYTQFVTDLATAMHAANPDSDVSVAVPADVYPGYDIAGLSANGAADTMMVMAYDYHYEGGSPGPVAPLADSTLWGAGSDSAAITRFKSLVTNPDKIVLGVPLYGYDWPTTASPVPGVAAKSAGSATAITWSTSQTDATKYGRLWDAASSTPFYIYQSGTTWHETFYEDVESMGDKLDLVVSSGIGGVGLWEVTYASTSFWNLLDEKVGGVDGGVAMAPDDAAPVDDLGEVDASVEDGGVKPHHASGGCALGGVEGASDARSGWLLLLGFFGIWKVLVNRNEEGQAPGGASSGPEHTLRL